MCLVCVYLLSVLSLCVVLFPCADVVMHVANPLWEAGAFTYMIMCVSLTNPHSGPGRVAGEGTRGGIPEVTALLL